MQREGEEQVRGVVDGFLALALSFSKGKSDAMLKRGCGVGGCGRGQVYCLNPSPTNLHLPGGTSLSSSLVERMSPVSFLHA
jgi:hypothetical protein